MADDVDAPQMGTKYPELFAALAAPFRAGEIRQRQGGGGRMLDYVTASTVANRLDSVIGPEAWDFAIQPWGQESLIGTLTVRLPDGLTISKSNVGGRAGMQAADDDAKSAASDCLKRCAALFGVARYLAGAGVPNFAADEFEGADEPQPHQRAGGRGQARDDPPRTGRALFAWASDQQENHKVKGLIDGMQRWGAEKGFPDRIVDWAPEQVKEAYTRATTWMDRKAERAPKPASDPRQGDAYEGEDEALA